MAISNKKLIISGDQLELYTYSKAILYDFTRRSKTIINRKKEGKITERSLRATRKKVSLLVHSNASQYHNFKPIFLTFTFKEDMTDLKEAQAVFTKFIKRLTYKIFKNKISQIKYLGVPEIHKKREKKYGKGVWHFHVIFFNLPFMEKIYDEILKLWGKGFTIVKTIKNTNHLSNYITKYLTKDMVDYRLFGKKKYFTSRGLKKPIIIRDQIIIDFIIENTTNLKLLYENNYHSPERDQNTRYQLFETDSISDLNLDLKSW